MAQAVPLRHNLGPPPATPTVLRDQIDREKIAYRFAPRSIQFTCIWTTDKDWNRAFGAINAQGVVPLNVRVKFENGKFNGCPKIMLTLDYAMNQASANEIKSLTDHRNIARNYGARLTVQPGVTTAIPDPNDANAGVTSAGPLWEIKSLTITKFSDLDATEDRDTICAAQRFYDPAVHSNLWIVKLSSEGGLIDQVWTAKRLSAMDPALLGVLSEVRANSCSDHIMIFEDDRDQQVVQPIEFTLDWWAMIINARLPPHAHVIDDNSGAVTVHLESDGVDEIGNHLYARYDRAQEQVLEQTFYQYDPLRYPVVFPVAPDNIHTIKSETYFSDPRDLEARLKIGIVHEHRHMASQLKAFEDQPVRVIVVKAMEWSYKVEETQDLTDSRYSYQVLVMSADGLVAPPDRTSFLLEPLYDPGTSDPNGPRAQWSGQVVHHPSSSVKEMGAKFCIFATKPIDGAPYQGPIYNTLEDAEIDYAQTDPSALVQDMRPSLGTMRLLPDINTSTRRRELTAITDVCDLSSVALRHIQMPLLYAYERRQTVSDVAIYDGDVSEDITPDELDRIWRTLGYVLSTHLNLNDNPGQLELVNSLRSLPGAITLVTGPAGSGKTTIAMHMAVVLALLDYQVTLQARDHEAVDNLAFEFDKACDNFIQWLVDEEEFDLANKVAEIWALRYDTLAFLDMSPLPHQDDINASAHASDSRFLSELAIATINEEAEVEVSDEQIRKDYIFGRLQAKTLHEAKLVNQGQRQLTYPGHMSMGAFLKRSRAQLPLNGNNFIEFFQLYDRAVSGELLQPVEIQTLKQLQHEFYSEVTRFSHVVICTVASGADDLIKSACDFDFAFFDAAEKLSVPTGILGLSQVKQHSFLLGDLNRIGIDLASTGFNSMAKQLSQPILTYLNEKAVHSIAMVKQYRTAPDVFEFINEAFCEGKVISDMVTKDIKAESAPLRAACRAFTRYLGVTSPVKDLRLQGSLLMGLNVWAGVTMQQEDSTLLVNFGECQAALQLASDLIVDQAIHPQDILIMTYYKGNVDILFTFQEGYPNTYGIQIKTVDECQNLTVKISIIVLGGTDAFTIKRLFRYDNHLSKTLTPHLLSPERLNVSLSRSTDLVVFVANFGALGRIREHDRNPATSGIALKSLAAYLLANHLVVDSNVVDQNPRLRLASNNDLRTAFEIRVACDQTNRLTELSKGWRRIRTQRKKEQAASKNISMPNVMGSARNSSAFFPGALNLESRQRQSMGKPLPNTKEFRKMAKEAAKAAKAAAETASPPVGQADEWM